MTRALCCVMLLAAASALAQPLPPLPPTTEPATMPADPNEQVKLLLSVLKRPLASDMDKVQAARDLGKLGPVAKAAAGALANLIGDPNVGPDAAEALGRLGKAAAPHLEQLVATLGNKSAAHRAGAARGLGHMGLVAAEAAPKLVPLLTDANAPVRAAAAEALAGGGNPPADAVLPMGKLLADDQPYVRRAAAGTLRAWGDAAHEALPQLVAAMDREGICVLVCETLAKIGQPAIEPVLAALGDKNEIRRAAAVDVLGRMGAPAVVPLQQALKNPSSTIRAMAAYALGKAGPAAEGATNSLIDLLGDEEVRVRWGAVAALSCIGGKAVEPLLTVLKGDNKSVRWWAVCALGRMGAAGKAAKPALVEALRDKNPMVRAQAAVALGQIDGEADCVPALIAAVGDGDSLVRWRAAEALGKFGKAAAAGKDALKKAAGDEDKDVRAATEAALKAVAGE